MTGVNEAALQDFTPSPDFGFQTSWKKKNRKEKEAPFRGWVEVSHGRTAQVSVRAPLEVGGTARVVSLGRMGVGQTA